MTPHSTNNFQVEQQQIYQARSQGGGRGGGLPPARLKQVQFALNIKHAFLILCLKLQA